MCKAREKKKGFHYAWVVFIVCFLMVFFSLGFVNSPKNLYLAPVTEDTGLSRTVFSLNDLFRYIVVGVMNIFFGFFVKKISPRLMVACGFASLVASLLVFSAASTALPFCLGGILLGIGFSWTTTTMVGYFVEKWFTNKKGSLMGIILAASGAGGAVATQLLSPVISGSTDGWRSSYRTVAIIIAIVGFLVVLLIRNKPSDKGLEALGNDVEVKEKSGSWSGFEEKEIFRKPYFYILIVCVLLYGTFLQSFDITSMAHLKDIGVESGTIANVSTVYMICLFLAKMSAGSLFDRLGLSRVLVLCSISGIAAPAFLAFVDNSPLVYIYSPLVAFAMPITTVLMPLLAMELFGKKAYAKVMGIFVGVMQIGFCCGSVLPNIFYDSFGTYKGIYLACSGILTAVTVSVVICIGRAKKERTEYLCSKNPGI